MQLTDELIKTIVDDMYICILSTEVLQNNNRLEETNNKELINIVSKSIRENNIEPLSEYYDNMFHEASDNNIGYYVSEFRTKLKNIDAYTDSDLVDSLVDENIETIENFIYEADKSITFRDFLYSITHLNCYIPLGFSNTDLFHSKLPIESAIKPITNFFNINFNEEDIDKIENLCIQGSDGIFVAWFTFDLADFIDDKNITIKIPKTITLSNLTLGVVNYNLGSGDYTELQYKVSFKLKPDNFIFDFITGYSFVHDVCGLVRNWNSKVTNSFKEVDKFYDTECETVISNTEELSNFENNYKLTGKCNFNDDNMNRHKTTYHNDFMFSRWECEDCGRYWLD